MDSITQADFQEAAKQFGYPPDITRGDIRYWDGGVKLAEVEKRARELAAHRRTAQADLVELLGEAFDFLGGCDGAAELRGKLLAALSKYSTDATKGKANGG